MVWRSLLVLALAGWLPGCGAGGPILLDPAADDDDDTGDDDTGDDDTGDDDTGTGCPWDGEYTGSTTFDIHYVETFYVPTSAEVIDCQIEGEILLIQHYPIWLDLMGTIDPVGTAAGKIIGEVGGLGTVDEFWNGSADDIGLTGEFALFEGNVGWGSFYLVPVPK